MRTVLLSLSAVVLCISISSCARSPERETVKITIPEPAPSIDQRTADADAPPPTVTDQQKTFGEERLLGDNSRITTTYDGAGNKTETREFPDGSELKFVRVFTAADGTVEATVYSQNGGARSVPGGMARGILSAPASEISRASESSTVEQQSPAQPQPPPRPESEVVQAAPSVTLKPTTVADTTSVQLPPVSRVKPPAD